MRDLDIKINFENMNTELFLCDRVNDILVAALR